MMQPMQGFTTKIMHNIDGVLNHVTLSMMLVARDGVFDIVNGKGYLGKQVTKVWKGECT